MNFFIEYFAIFCVLLGGIVFHQIKMKKTVSLQSWLVKQGLDLDYQYGGVLGIDSTAGKAFIYTDAAYVLMPGDVRSIEKSSILETKYNAWGKGFHKDKECRLILHTMSLDSPVHVIGFNTKSEMELWYSRLGLFFKLS